MMRVPRAQVEEAEYKVKMYGQTDERVGAANKARSDASRIAKLEMAAAVRKQMEREREAARRRRAEGEEIRKANLAYLRRDRVGRPFGLGPVGNTR